MHHELIPAGDTVHKEVLTNQWEVVPFKCHKMWVLLHENFQHIGHSLHRRYCPHPFYCPIIIPHDFYHFLWMKSCHFKAAGWDSLALKIALLKATCGVAYINVSNSSMDIGKSM
jgi:hypothetical protein